MIPKNPYIGLTEDQHCFHHAAETKTGSMTAATNPDAVKWCAYGAYTRLNTKQFLFDSLVWGIFRDGLRARFNMGPIDLNDSQRTPFSFFKKEWTRIFRAHNRKMKVQEKNAGA